MPRHRTTRDHYVPRFLLRNWERDQEGKRIFWVYEKKTGGSVHPGSAKATHFEYDYDRFITDLGREHSFQEDFGAIETRAAHVVRACLTALRPPTGSEREDLAIFLSLQLCRVPAAREAAKALVEGYMVHYCQGLSRRPAALARVMARYEEDTGESLGNPEKLREALARTGTEIQVVVLPAQWQGWLH